MSNPELSPHLTIFLILSGLLVCVALPLITKKGSQSQSLLTVHPFLPLWAVVSLFSAWFPPRSMYWAPKQDSYFTSFPPLAALPTHLLLFPCWMTEQGCLVTAKSNLSQCYWIWESHRFLDLILKALVSLVTCTSPQSWSRHGLGVSLVTPTYSLLFTEGMSTPLIPFQWHNICSSFPCVNS